MDDKQNYSAEDILGSEIVPSNPWFETYHGRIEFVKFQHDLEALGRYVEVLDDSLRTVLEEKRAAFKRKDFLLGVPDGWSGEAEDGAQEELRVVEHAMPHFAFGSVLALCFMLLEQLFRDLVRLEELRRHTDFKRFPRKRGEPKVQRAHRFLAEFWAASPELDEETAGELNRLRALRNKFIHAASIELAAETISVPEVSVTREDIEAALTAIGSYAELLESELEASYSKG